jgi:hypothetical protein
LLNIQYYNQTPDYNSYTPIFQIGPLSFPQTAIHQVITNGVPANRVVLGTFLQTGDGSNLPNSPSQWHTWVNQAFMDFGWHGGAMVWEYHSTGSPTAAQWVQTIFPQ